MKKWVGVLCLVSLFCGSCVHQYRDTTLYHPTGRQKPIVAVLPVISHVATDEISWDLSREFTDEIRKRVYDSPKIYLLRNGSNLELSKQLNVLDPKKLPKETVSKLVPAEFAVIAELIDQRETPYGVSALSKEFKEEGSGSILSLAMRVRVIDLRQSEPKVILQEILHHDYDIAKAYLSCNYNKSSWGTEAFQRTPMGIAHARLMRELVAHVESYVEAAR